MKTQLPSKSKNHQEIIEQITNIIKEQGKDKIAYVILFGSFAKGTWVDDARTEKDGTNTFYNSDYDLCSILLPDSGYLHEEDAKRANKYGYTKHHPALPLYTKLDAINSLEYFETVDFGQKYSLAKDLSFVLSRSGHILGSAFISLYCDNKTIVFSGDVGRLNDAVMKTPAELQHADYLLIESTYGDRLHVKADPIKEIGKIINQTIAVGGNLIIPSFAVGRTQSLLYYIYQLKKEKQIPDIPVFLDSPMAIDATELLCKYKNEHRLSENLCNSMCYNVKYTRTVEESKHINQLNIPSIIISASGMATGGRILHHLKHYLSNHKNTILFTGFQAGGTRGDRIIKGEKLIKIHGDMYAVKAKIKILHNVSAHADYSEILQWLNNFNNPPKKVFITHGEEQAAISLKEKIEKTLGWNAVIPEYLQTEDL